MINKLKDFNLLISTSRGNERNALRETWYLLREIGDPNAKVESTRIIGLVIAKTILDPINVVDKFREILIERPWEFRYILKVTPIQLVTESTIEHIQTNSEEISKLIDTNESYRITINKRHTNLRTSEIIESIAPKIRRKVNLGNPDKILLIEVLEALTGISLIKLKDILSIEKEKRNL